MKNFKHFFKSASRVLVSLVLGMLVSTPLFAAAPSEINYQGKLTDSSGVPYNGSKNITFSFWDNATVGSGAQLGANVVVNGVNVVNGVFNTVINVAGIPFLTNQNVYLQIQIDGSNFGPTRQKLVAAPYALAVAAGSVGVTELNTTSVDARYVGKSGNETINGDKTISGNWDNSTNPWTDDEVADTLNLVAGSTVSAISLRSGTVPNVRLDNSSVTLQGNTFNGADQLVKLDGTGALPVLNGVNLTGVTASVVGANSVGTTQIINSTIALVDLNISSIDTRYISTDTAQVITATKTITAPWTINANWVNMANPWSDAEVDNVLSVLAGSTVSASAIDAGTLDSDVIASSVAVNAVTTTQILDNTITLADLNTTGSVDNRYVTTATAQGISGLKTFSNGILIGAAGDTIAQYVTVTDLNRNIGNMAAGTSTSFTVAVPGSALGDVVLVTPRETTWIPSVFLLGFVSSAGNVTVNVKNTDTGNSNVGTVDFQISVIQH